MSAQRIPLLTMAENKAEEDTLGQAVNETCVFMNKHGRCGPYLDPWGLWMWFSVKDDKAALVGKNPRAEDSPILGQMKPRRDVQTDPAERKRKCTAAGRPQEAQTTPFKDEEIAPASSYRAALES